MIQLHDFELSGNCYKVRLMLKLLGLPHEIVAVNLREGEHKTPQFLAMNPFGQLPVLCDGDVVLRESQAILVYLAQRYAASQWWPNDAVALARIHAWLATAANEITRGPSLLRMHHKFGRDINIKEAAQVTGNVLSIIETRLAAHDWIATDQVSIADIAIYPYVALAHEGKVDLTLYPSIGAWFKRIAALPGYIAMPGLFSA